MWLYTYTKHAAVRTRCREAAAWVLKWVPFLKYHDHSRRPPCLDPPVLLYGTVRLLLTQQRCNGAPRELRPMPAWAWHDSLASTGLPVFRTKHAPSVPRPPCTLPCMRPMHGTRHRPQLPQTCTCRYQRVGLRPCTGRNLPESRRIPKAAILWCRGLCVKRETQRAWHCNSPCCSCMYRQAQCPPEEELGQHDSHWQPPHRHCLRPGAQRHWHACKCKCKRK